MSSSDENPGRKVATGIRMAAIDKELESLYAQISSLKAERNSIAFISTLPNEILVQIFSVYAEESSSGSGLYWTKLILVCRHWHALALGSPVLWSNIRFPWELSEKRLLIQLDRSGAAPLKIEIGSLASYDFTEAILSNSGRLTLLHLGGDPNCLLKLVDKMRHHDFPILQSLFLTPREDMVTQTADPSITLHPELFDGRMPRLRSLRCRGSTPLGNACTPYNLYPSRVVRNRLLPRYHCLP
ncbi:hypothetical protein C8R44DRAFT_32347 [Mycena epipterygia]|nr:hypothetical protein C8R44DRAFT_32347 [Mycena epipterygia]